MDKIIIREDNDETDVSTYHNRTLACTTRLLPSHSLLLGYRLVSAARIRMLSLHYSTDPSCRWSASESAIGLIWSFIIYKQHSSLKSYSKRRSTRATSHIIDECVAAYCTLLVRLPYRHGCTWVIVISFVTSSIIFYVFPF